MEEINMVVEVIGSTPDRRFSNMVNWYEGAVGELFDVKVAVHPVFGYNYYILLNTDNNMEYFKDDPLSLMVLSDGFFGIDFNDALPIRLFQ
jgi:hypothetical protein